LECGFAGLSTAKAAIIANTAEICYKQYVMVFGFLTSGGRDLLKPVAQGMHMSVRR